MPLLTFEAMFEFFIIEPREEHARKKMLEATKPT